MDSETKPKRKYNPQQKFVDLEGNPLPLTKFKIDKWHRDALVQSLGFEMDGKKRVTAIDPEFPLGEGVLRPGPDSPICAKCGLDKCGAKNPYMEYGGSEDPLVTIIMDSVAPKEDEAGEVGVTGPSRMMAKFIDKVAIQTGVPLDRIRWVPATRCAFRGVGKKPNYRTKGKWCRHFVIQDLMDHPPKLIMTVGTAAHGLFSYKSNVFDWGGRLLTFRGLPDDWLTEPKFMKPKRAPGETREWLGHPLFGLPNPEMRLPLFPVQSPRMVYATQNPHVTKAWYEDIGRGLALAADGVEPMDYERPWYEITNDPNRVRIKLEQILKHPGLLVCYDTETTGLKQWNSTASIVFMMFRWEDPVTDEPQSIGFPWDYEARNGDVNNVRPAMEDLKPLILKVFSQSRMIGHNLTFDTLFTYATLFQRNPAVNPIDKLGLINPEWRAEQDILNALADASRYDTWHMAFARQQSMGSLSLEALAYRWVPDLAGYEEEMRLLIGLESDLLDPGANKGGHYANCPQDKWDSHFRSYVMGDVEVCYQARDILVDKLKETKTYTLPLAHTTKRGKFRRFEPPNRWWVYKNIMSKASQMLIKMMGRGMHVDMGTLNELEDHYPIKINEAREAMRKATPEIEEWCLRNERETPGWELDLEKKDQLKEILFGEHLLNLPIVRLTKSGKDKYGEDEEKWADLSREEMYEYAAMDKYTLNTLAVDHPEVRPLQDYRKVHKIYGTYVRPLRNIMTAGIDKKERDKEPHLCFDSCVHGQFLLTGTRGGRLSSREPNLQNQPSDALVKKMYTSRFGELGCMYAGDLSQIELRLLAAVCGDRAMVRAYLDELDLHTMTTAGIYGEKYETYTKENMEKLQQEGKGDRAKELDLQRRVGKTCNFLTGYGGGAFGLMTVLASSKVYKSLEECEEILEKFFRAYPGLKDYLGYYKKFIANNGVAVSLLGRVRVFEEVFGEDKEAKAKALRAGCNHLIQSTASDIMLICLIAIEDMMREYGLQSIMVSTVHDSLLIDALRSELDEVHEIVDYVLNNIPDVLKLYFGHDYDTSWILVPLTGDCEVGLNYLDMNKIPAEGPIDWDELLREKE